MTQTFVDRYMEDDMIYKIIGFARDNVVYFVALFVTGIATFFSGKLYGVKTHSVISALKERYENIETQKKKLRKQISFLAYIDKLLKKFVILISLAQVGLIGNIIFHRGFDYTVLMVNSLSRNLILLLSLGLLVFIITQKGLRKFKTSKIQYLSTIHSGMDDIADKLLKSLGPELTTILKQKLQVRSVNTVSSGTQTIAKEPKEIKQKPEVVINPAEVNELKKQIAALEAANQTKMGAIEYEEIAKAILKKDLFRHKVFIQKLKSFEWCENCLLHAEQEDEAEQEEEKIKEQVEQNEEGGAPEKTHPVNPENKDEIDAAKNAEEQKKEDVGNNGDQKGGEKCACVNECLKRYFEMGFEMSEQFNNEEKEIVALKNKFGLIRRNSTA